MATTIRIIVLGFIACFLHVAQVIVRALGRALPFPPGRGGWRLCHSSPTPSISTGCSGNFSLCGCSERSEFSCSPGSLGKLARPDNHPAVPRWSEAPAVQADEIADKPEAQRNTVGQQVHACLAFASKLGRLLD